MNGNITEYPIPTQNSFSNRIVAGPHGNMWFTELKGNKIGRISMAGQVTEYPVSSAGPGIVLGPDGALWFIRSNDNKIGRITTDGGLGEYPIPTQQSLPLILTRAKDDSLWFTEVNVNKIGRLVIQPATLPATGKQPSYAYVGLLMVAGLGMLAMGWMVRRRNPV